MCIQCVAALIAVLAGLSFQQFWICHWMKTFILYCVLLSFKCAELKFDRLTASLEISGKLYVKMALDSIGLAKPVCCCDVVYDHCMHSGRQMNNQ